MSPRLSSLIIDKLTPKMTKRTRDTQLTKDDLEQEIAAEEANNGTVVQGGSHVADISVLNARRIVKVKRHNQATSTVTTQVLDKPK